MQIYMHIYIHKNTSNHTRTHTSHNISHKQNDAYFKKEPARYCKLILSGLCFEKCVPFNFFQGHHWRQFMTTHPQGNALAGFNPRKPLAERYSYFKKSVSKNFLEAAKRYGGVPFLNVNLDLYANPILGKKFVALRVNWFQRAGGVFSVNLAVREYSPHSRGMNSVASQVLYDWMEDHLALYGINYDEHVLGSTAGKQLFHVIHI